MKQNFVIMLFKLFLCHALKLKLSYSASNGLLAQLLPRSTYYGSGVSGYCSEHPYHVSPTLLLESYRPADFSSNPAPTHVYN